MSVLRVVLLFFVFTLQFGCDNHSSSQVEQTTTLSLDINLDPTANRSPEEFSPFDTSTYNEFVSRTIYDSLLAPHTLQLFFIKQQISNAQPNTWNLAVRVDNINVADPLDSESPHAAMFTIVFNSDGSKQTVISDNVLISNWTPVNADNLSNGAIGPVNVSQGATIPIQLPPISSNFVIDTDQITQRVVDKEKTVRVTPRVQLDQTANVPTELFVTDSVNTFNHKSTHTIIDSLGIEHVLALYYIKVDEMNTWSVIAKVAERDVGDPLLGTEPTIKSFMLKFMNNGQLDELNSDPGLVSNWDPLDEDGLPNGASRPLNVVNGGALPIMTYELDSNFEIEFSDTVLLL
jgi:flagellar hook protein FlgE